MNTVVYQWLRKEGTPYYIGIGNPRRPYRGRRLCGCPPPRDRIVILHENLEWEEACRIEKELISFYGRKDLGTGILRNLTDGGEGIVNLSEKSRGKISKANSGKNHPFFGKERSEETKKKISKANSGKKRTEETKKKMSEAQSGKKLSEETKLKLSKASLGRKHTKEAIAKFSGKNHPMYGKKHTKESKEKMSKANSGENNPRFGKNHSEETKKKISDMHKGKKLSERTKKKLSEAGIGEKSHNRIPRDWCHPVHGTVLQKSASELARLFPEQKLNRGHLAEVARGGGKRFQHKGWISLKA
jgi:hypothetical protein